MIDVIQVDKLASLARLKLDSVEKARLVKEIEAILKYVDQIKSVSALSESKEDASVVNVMREDTVPHDDGIYSEKLLSAAPKREGQYFKVKKIL